MLLPFIVEGNAENFLKTTLQYLLVNPIKIRALVVSRYRAHAPSFPNLLLNESVVEMVTELKVLCAVLDTKRTFESHMRLIDASAPSKLRIMRKALYIYISLVTQILF